jgi:hypothetical protein
MVALEECTDADRDAAGELLLDRFSHLRGLVNKLLASRDIHCHLAGRDLSTDGFRLALIEADGECVAVACHRHAPSPRRSLRGIFTELLLLAVHREQEGRGHARAIVGAVLRDSVAAKSEELLVVSSGHRMWTQPLFGLTGKGDSKQCGFPILSPWSRGIEILGRPVTSEAADTLDAAGNSAAPGRRQTAAVRARATQAKRSRLSGGTTSDWRNPGALQSTKRIRRYGTGNA